MLTRWLHLTWGNRLNKTILGVIKKTDQHVKAELHTVIVWLHVRCFGTSGFFSIKTNNVHYFVTRAVYSVQDIISISLRKSLKGYTGRSEPVRFLCKLHCVLVQFESSHISMEHNNCKLHAWSVIGVTFNVILTEHGRCYCLLGCYMVGNCAWHVLSRLHSPWQLVAIFYFRYYYVELGIYTRLNCC